MSGMLLMGLNIAKNILNIIGYYGIFKKSGKKGWYAILPGIRDYVLAVTAEREEEGKTYCILTACYFLSDIMFCIYEKGSMMWTLFSFLSIGFGLSALFYSIHIIHALCHLYGRSRVWVVLWMFFSPIVSIIWGYNKNFQPVHMTEDIDYSKAAKISGATLDAIKNGLTVNLNDRTVIDFFRKKCLLRDIHLSIPTGRMVLLLGGSGAGKTTFLNAITGYEKADAKVILNGGDVYGNYESMKYDLGFVPQQDLMRDGDTVYLSLIHI